MSQIIDFSNFRPEAVRLEPSHESKTVAAVQVDENYRLTLTILSHHNPGKLLFSPKETGTYLGVGEEFIRRRIKSGIIKVTYIGDKPMVQIIELARLITEGIQ